MHGVQVLLNQKQEPLLYSSTANNTRESPSVILKFQPGSAVVPLRYSSKLWDGVLFADPVVHVDGAFKSNPKRVTQLT